MNFDTRSEGWKFRLTALIVWMSMGMFAPQKLNP